ncbi:MAG: hypothetical protein EAZ41_05180, partial [Sphingobacteriia bacterium]
MYQVSEYAKKAKEAKAEKKAEKRKKSFIPFDMAIDDIEFQELVMQTETAPFLQVKYLGARAEMEVGSFAAQVAVELRTGFNSRGVADANATCLHFDAALQFADGKIGGAMGIDIYSKTDIRSGSFEFENIKLTSVNIAANYSGVEFDGALDIMDDKNYGRGFSGQMILTVAKVVKIKAGAMFGTKFNADGSSFTYFNVDGGADFKPAGVMLFGTVKITGFQGGVSYKMDVVKPSGNYPVTVTGVSYVPNENSFLRLRAGVYLSIGDEKLLSGFGGLEFVFNQNWGLEEVSISGNAQVFSQMPNDDKTKISPLTKGRQQTYMSYKASQGEDVADSKESKGISASRARRPGTGGGVGGEDNAVGSVLQMPDTISVLGRMKELQPSLNAAYFSMLEIQRELDFNNATLANNERTLAAMKRRSDSISNPGRTDIAAKYNGFFGVGGSLAGYSYRSRNLEIWPEVARLLNIPETGMLDVRRTTYTLPTQARITKIKDSLTRIYSGNNDAIISQYGVLKSYYFRSKDTADKAYNGYSSGISNKIWRDRYGYIDYTIANKSFNENLKNQWGKRLSLRNDSLAYYTRVQDSLLDVKSKPVPI